jgi:ABC-type multidrug transport system ATPase subunit
MIHSASPGSLTINSTIATTTELNLAKPNDDIVVEISNENVHLQEKPPIQLEWRDIEYIVPVRPNPPSDMNAFKRFLYRINPRKKVPKTILHKMTAYVKPGNVLAIMGPSGAGKTSLLNILAQRIPQKRYGGQITVNGKNVGKSFRSLSAFVQQDDVILGNLTVRETLRYASLLRLRGTNQFKTRRIDEVMEQLGLTRAADTIIGIPAMGIKGISGGERKRLAIAMELLTEPSVLFLDEPTTGLDAKTAQNVMELITKIAQNGRAVVCTIHQPRSNIFALFDKLLLLSKGKVAYMGDAKEAAAYFAKLGYTCPVDYNPADFFIDLISETTSNSISIVPASGIYGNLSDNNVAANVMDGILTRKKSLKQMDTERINMILNYYETQVAQQYEPPQVDSHLDTHLGRFGNYSSTWLAELLVIMIRSYTNMSRDKMVTFARFFQTVIFALIIGLIFFRIGYTQSNVQDRLGVLFFMLLNQSLAGMFNSLIAFLTEEK